VVWCVCVGFFLSSVLRVVFCTCYVLYVRYVFFCYLFYAIFFFFCFAQVFSSTFLLSCNNLLSFCPTSTVLYQTVFHQTLLLPTTLSSNYPSAEFLLSHSRSLGVNSRFLCPLWSFSTLFFFLTTNCPPFLAANFSFLLRTFPSFYELFLPSANSVRWRVQLNSSWDVNVNFADVLRVTEHLLWKRRRTNSSKYECMSPNDSNPTESQRMVNPFSVTKSVAVYCVPRSACNLLHSACSLLHSACSLLHSACNLLHSACNLLHSACSLLHSSSAVSRAVNVSGKAKSSQKRKRTVRANSWHDER